MQSPSTRLWRRWYSSGGADRARLTAKAILSALQYEANATAPLNTKATSVEHDAVADDDSDRGTDEHHDADESGHERHAAPFVRSDQFEHRGGSELDRRSDTGLVLGLEVLLGFEVERLRDEHRRELLEFVVVGEHAVVVELSGVRDPALGGP